MDFPATAGRYPDRQAVVDYLESYAAQKGLSPRFGSDVTRVNRQGDLWQVEHSGGQEQAEAVVFCTGLNGTPRLPDWAGDFAGPVIHSADYRNSAPFEGQRVLVVGFGNSGGDIALDLGRAGVAVAVSVRGPVQILPKEILGLPITSFGVMSKLLGPRLADRLTAPILRMHVGRPEDYGLVSANKGPATMVSEDGRVPLIDVGTLGAIREGLVAVRPGVAAVEGREVCFADGTVAEFDAVVAATGYTVDLRPLLGDDCHALDHKGRPKVSGGATDEPGLYFCSYRASANGQLRASGIEARAIAQHLASSLAITS
jgi:cation diffusion facilitator CzcD-associated flavoprotein CzcO